VVGAPGVLVNDTDADSDALTAELSGGGISGSFDLDENGGFRYTPGGGFSGSGTVNYRVWDGVAWSATTTISLTIQAATLTPAPTPRPTPRPTPFVPLPSLPPILPLPSLPLPSPIASQDASPRPSPSAAPTNAVARSSPSPTDMPAGTDAGLPGPSSAPLPIGPGIDPGLVATGRTSEHSRLLFDRDQLDLQTGGLGLLAGFHIWAVPAASIAVPGLLVLLWVALQTSGALVWIPAVRRMRNERGAVRQV
jgi:hypothetical protein